MHAYARSVALVVMCAMGGCDFFSDRDGPTTGSTPDASPDATRTTTPRDAPFTCTPAAPVVPGPIATCLALEASTFTGTTPFGNLDVTLDYFGAGDCITISQAAITWIGACGEQLWVQFSYPVTSDGTKRHVTTSFDVDARITFQPSGGAMQMDVAPIHVEVARWQEGTDMHDIDITVTVNDPMYAVAPFRVHGTFCDWPYYLC